MAATQRAHPDVRVEEIGDASANKALEAVFSEDLLVLVFQDGLGESIFGR